MSVHTVNINGIDLVYEKEGSGPPLVFIHGGNQSAIYWEAVVPHIMDTHTCYVLEQRGHGRSGRSPTESYSLSDFADELGGFIESVAGPSILVGHSQGGHAAFGVAVRKPGLVRAIYSEDCVPWVGAVSVARKIPLFRAFPVMGEVGRRTEREGLSVAGHAHNLGEMRFGSERWADQEPPERLIHNARSGYRTDPAWFDVAADIDNFAWSDQEAFELTRNLHCPVHLAHGNPKLGGLIRPEALQSLGDAGVQYSATYFPDIGHVIAGSSPREYINDLKAFLATVE